MPVRSPNKNKGVVALGFLVVILGGPVIFLVAGVLCKILAKCFAFGWNLF